MPCPFTDPKRFGLIQVFCARPKIYLHINLFHLLYSSTFTMMKQIIVAVTKILCLTKNDLNSVKLVFVPTQKFLKRH